MALINPPLYLQAGTYPASTDSTGIAAWLIHDDVAQHVRSGVIFNNSTSLKATAGGPGVGSVSIADGRAVVDNGAGGAYLCTLRGATNVSIPGTDASPRNDLIGVSILDSSNGDVGDVWTLARVEGTPGAIPIDPPEPDFFTPICRVAMPGGASEVLSGYVTDRRKFTSTVGGVLVCTSSTRPAVTKLPYGQVIFETDTSRLKVWNGTLWANAGGSPITAETNSSVGLNVDGAASQTANLQNWRNSSGTVLAHVNNVGKIYSEENAVITTADTAALSVATAGNAGLLDGIDSTGFSLSAHTHDPSGYSVNYANSAGSAGSASNSTQVGGLYVTGGTTLINAAPSGGFPINTGHTIVGFSFCAMGGSGTILDYWIESISGTTAYVHVTPLSVPTPGRYISWVSVGT